MTNERKDLVKIFWISTLAWVILTLTIFTIIILNPSVPQPMAELPIGTEMYICDYTFFGTDYCTFQEKIQNVFSLYSFLYVILFLAPIYFLVDAIHSSDSLYTLSVAVLFSPYIFIPFVFYSTIYIRRRFFRKK